MVLYFRNSDNQLIKIAEPRDYKEADQEICKYMEERNCKFYYMRGWMDENIPYRTWYDFGSHVEFFVIDDEPKT